MTAVTSPVRANFDLVFPTEPTHSLLERLRSEPLRVGTERYRVADVDFDALVVLLALSVPN
jgi:hypothetical protein